jgi:hypothetical protein
MPTRRSLSFAAMMLLGGGAVTLALAQVDFGGGLGGFSGGGGGGYGGGGRGSGRGGGGRGGRFGEEYLAGNEPITPLPRDRTGVPEWPVDPQFKSDVFTFVRIRYHSVPQGTYFDDGIRKTGGGWKNDWASSDLDVSFRLQQMTSMKVNPEPVQLQLTDPRLFDYPFIYMIQVGRLELTPEEVDILRRYLLNGGFVMADDHWGVAERRNWQEQMKRVFPDRPQVEIGLDHPVFHCVFDLKAKPQVPPIQLWYRWQQLGEPERSWKDPNDREPRYYAIYDDHNRMMAIECANTDLGDGWEREGENEEFFHRFSEKQSYPMAINIIFYAMTH